MNTQRIGGNELASMEKEHVGNFVDVQMEKMDRSMCFAKISYTECGIS